MTNVEDQRLRGGLAAGLLDFAAGAAVAGAWYRVPRMKSAIRGAISARKREPLNTP
jgi:hypothetical protein